MILSELILLVISPMCFANYNYDYEEISKDYPDLYNDLTFKRELPNYPNIDRRFDFQRSRNNFGPPHQNTLPNSYGKKRNGNFFQNQRSLPVEYYNHNRMQNPAFSNHRFRNQIPSQNQAHENKSFLSDNKPENYTETDPALPKTEAMMKTSAITEASMTTKEIKRELSNSKKSKHQRTADVKNIDFKRTDDNMGKWFDKEMSDVDPDGSQNTNRPKMVVNRETKQFKKLSPFRNSKTFSIRAEKPNALIQKRQKIRRNLYRKRYEQKPFIGNLPLIPDNSINEEYFNNEGYKKNVNRNLRYDINPHYDYPEENPDDMDETDDNSQMPNSEELLNQDKRDATNEFNSNSQQFRPALREASSTPSAPINSVVVTVTAPLQEKNQPEKSDLIDQTNEVLSKEVLRSPNVEEKMQRVVENIRSKKTLLNDKRLQQETSIIENENQRVNDDVSVKSEVKANKTEPPTVSASGNDMLYQDMNNKNDLPADQSMSNQNGMPSSQNIDNNNFLPSNHENRNFLPPDQREGDRNPLPLDQGEGGTKILPPDQGESGIKILPPDQGEGGIKILPPNQGESGIKILPLDQGKSNRNFLSSDQDVDQNNFSPQEPRENNGNFYPSDQGVNKNNFLQPEKGSLNQDYDLPNEDPLLKSIGNNDPPSNSRAGNRKTETKSDTESKPIRFKNGEMVVITTGPPSDQQDKSATVSNNAELNSRLESTTDLFNVSMPDIYLKEEKVEKESKLLLRNKEAFRNKTAIVKGERKSEIKNNKETFREVFVQEKGEDKYPIRIEDAAKNDKEISGLPRRNNVPNTRILNSGLRGQNQHAGGGRGDKEFSKENANKNNPANYDYNSDYKDAGPGGSDYSYNYNPNAKSYREVNSGDRFIDDAAGKNDVNFQRESLGDEKSQVKVDSRDVSESENQESAGNVVYFPPTTTASQYNSFLHTRDVKSSSVHRRHLSYGRP